MEQTQTLTQNVETLFTNMEKFAQKEGVIGKPVTQGDKTFLPVISITLGYGGGDTQSKTTQSGSNTTVGMPNMTGGAMGLGARLYTDAVIIINKDNVSMVPVSAASTLSQMVDKVPQILQSISSQQQNKQ